MNEEIYNKIYDKVKNNSVLYGLFKISDKVSVALMVIVYFIILAREIYNGCYKRAIKIVMVTSSAFGFVTIIRKVIKCQRPFEKMDIKPLYENISRKKEQNSFPSRHATSAMVIAMAALYENVLLGVFMFIIAIIIAFLRVIGGVHYIKDVVVGSIIGIVTGILGFFVK